MRKKSLFNLIKQHEFLSAIETMLAMGIIDSSEASTYSSTARRLKSGELDESWGGSLESSLNLIVKLFNNKKKETMQTRSEISHLAKSPRGAYTLKVWLKKQARAVIFDDSKLSKAFKDLSLEVEKYMEALEDNSNHDPTGTLWSNLSNNGLLDEALKLEERLHTADAMSTVHLIEKAKEDLLDMATEDKIAKESITDVINTLITAYDGNDAKVRKLKEMREEVKETSSNLLNTIAKRLYKLIH